MHGRTYLQWVKQILHVFSVNNAATDAIGRTGGGFVDCDPDPALRSECP